LDDEAVTLGGIDMPELQWNVGWTLAALGVCWLVLSCLVAFALGQIIKRGKAKPEASVSDASEPRGLYADVAPSDDELADLEASRAASGTRLKPVRFEGEEELPSRRKVS
jgi:hypothetical protein